MIKEAINRILEIATPPTFKDCEGVERYTAGGSAIEPPMRGPTFGSSLDGVVEAAMGERIVQCTYSKVVVFELEKYNKRVFKSTIHVANPILPDDFQFGRYMSIEDFLIETSDSFVRNENYKNMIAAVSCITDVQEHVVDDNGVSQTVTYKSRIGRKDSGKLEPFVNLRAYHTYREIEQPESTYLIRIDKNSKGPIIALHEASGYDWKVKCTEAVYEYIKTRVEESVKVIK